MDIIIIIAVIVVICQTHILSDRILSKLYEFERKAKEKENLQGPVASQKELHQIRQELAEIKQRLKNNGALADETPNNKTRPG